MNFYIFLVFTFCEALYYKNFYYKKPVNYDLNTVNNWNKNNYDDYFEEVYGEFEEYYERLDKYYSKIKDKVSTEKQNFEDMYMRDEITLIEYKYLKDSFNSPKEKRKPFLKFGKIIVR
uniref:Uncharacterized protein n=1 Tax=viral metagenome TaxID=1070528 RepID=A0A6C0L1Q9_9ZZZZ|tara:strand:+ start:11000 stop:11353 length:354 start_codon:yes stop_codon:yes gene_type:complete